MQTFSIGRNASNNIVLNDDMVSRQHAEMIVMDNGQVMIKDLGSSNGTFVNGNKINESFLKAGDIVKCGTSFVKWSNFINEGVVPIIRRNQSEQEQIFTESEQNAEYNFSLGGSLKYIMTRIFNVGDLFKTEWDKTQSILFFALTPLVLTFVFGLIFFLKTEANSFIPHSFFYVVIMPVVIVSFNFGIAQFLAISLLSLKGKAAIINNLLAASIFSFLMYMLLFIPGLITIPFSSLSGMSKIGPTEIAILILILIPFEICMAITIITFVYKYFRAIGISKSISIHFTVFAFFLNLFLQLAFTYFLMALAYKSIFDFFKML